MPRTTRRAREGATVLLLCLCLFSSVTAAAEEEQPADRWTPALSMQYPGIQGTAVSPGGEYVAYVVREAVMEGERSEYLSQVWVVGSDGKRPVQYTRGEKSAGNPAFSPDGESLAFTSERSGEKTQVWVMPVTGGEAARVTDAETGVGAFAWSPDGGKIAYLMQDPETQEEKDAKKEKRDVILVNRNFKYGHLYTIDVAQALDGNREARRLTRGDFHVVSFDWSPDGETLVFAHRRDPRINTGELSGDIATVPADSGEVVPLVVSDGVHDTPRYSPDGRTVVFRSTGERPEPIGAWDLYVVPAEGGARRRLGETPDRNPAILGWTGDGKSVLASEFLGTTRQLLSVPASGGQPRRLTEGEWLIGSPSLDPRGAFMAFTIQTTETPPDVYLSPVKRFRKKRLTDLCAKIPRPPMGRTELLRWESRDGLPIEGLLTYPVGYREGRRYPLILNVHGGPAGVFGRWFTGAPGIYMIQFFAQEGYAVLRPNPRGSTGYGKEFRYANYKDWGYGDLDDLLAGVDAVIEMGVAHPDSLALMGWSYGGYMTSFAVTRTDRFRAASMGAGLPNLVSMLTTTDIPDYLAAHFGGDPWEDYETYEKHSAIYRIKNVTTPTQVIHGANDLRVPFTQGQEFYNALLRLGVPTEMIVYPRTPHGPREPKFVMDVSKRILAWFDLYVKNKVAEEEKETQEPVEGR